MVSRLFVFPMRNPPRVISLGSYPEQQPVECLVPTKEQPYHPIRPSLCSPGRSYKLLLSRLHQGDAARACV